MSNPSHRLSFFPTTCQPGPCRGDLGDADPPLFGVPRAQGAGLRRARAHAESARKLQAAADSSHLVAMSRKCDIPPAIFIYIQTVLCSHVACGC